MEFILIEGEFRSLIRNAFERIIGDRIPKKENSNLDIINKLAIRVISSLIGIYIYNQLQTMPEIRQYSTYIMIALFFYLNKDYLKEQLNKLKN